MTPLQQTVLDFCRECLGWETATESMWWQCSNRMVVFKRGRTVVKRLRYTDLNAVMDATYVWSAARGLYLAVTSQPPTKMFRWRVQITSDSYTLDNDLCNALLAACVAAHRKLKGISHD